MKKIAFIIAFFVLTTFSYAQSEERSLASFTGVKISSAFDVELVQGTESKIIITVIPEEYLKNVITEVKNNVLNVYVKGKIKNTKKMHLTITYQTLNSIVASGATSITGKNVINSDHFKIETSGASSLTLNLISDEVTLISSGASECKLTGTTSIFKTTLSGASCLKAKSFKAKKVSINASGASDVNVYASQGVSGITSGASDVDVYGSPSIQKINSSGASDITFVKED